MTTFFQVTEVAVDHKSEALRRGIQALRIGTEAPLPIFARSPHGFSAVPKTPFAYWVPDALCHLFVTNEPLEDNGREVCSGATTNDDKRFLRLWFEVLPTFLTATRHDTKEQRWRVLAKGGEHSRFYLDLSLVIDWADDGRGVKAHIADYRGSRGWGYQWSAALNGYTNYFRPGLTWSRRSQRGLSLRALPADCIFGDKGPAVFAPGNDPQTLTVLLAIANSGPFLELVAAQMAFGSYEVGVLERTPLPKMDMHAQAALEELGARAWSLKRLLDTINETSHAFLLPSGLNERITGIDGRTVGAELDAIEHQITDLAIKLYGIGSEGRATFESAVQRPFSNEALENASGEDDEELCDDGSLVGADFDALGSWLIGVSFGRFDPRLATGERITPDEPGPFDPLPPRSPGMYPEGEEPADRPDILVDDEGHADDITAHAVAVAERVRVDTTENLRGWLAKEFFPLHIRMYSKSRRRAPIYWQLATPSANYSVWLYIHAFSKDTLFRVQNDYVVPKLAHEERRLESLTSELRYGSTAAQRKQLAGQKALVDELRAFLDEVKRVAPLWKPNLDDGVIINFAPLWRLVPQNKSWQKELKSTWDALRDGKYDWAHLAMHLWPERVVPKCAKDRSLAIAHGLEDVFWAESADGKWIARKAPTTSVNELVKERTSPAVKSALARLLEASVPSGKTTARKGGGRRNGNFAAAPEDLPTFAESAWARPHIMERGEIQAAILAVLKANGAPMARDEARLAALLCLEPHLLIPQLDATDKKTWLRFVGVDGKKPITASIGNTIQEWGSALSGLRGRGRLDESLRQNTWAIGAGADAIDTRGWPEGRAGFVIDVLRRRQAVTQLETIIRKLPPPVQQWFANAA